MSSEKYDDDEEVKVSSTATDDDFDSGGAKVRLHNLENKAEVPLEDSKHQVLLELAAQGKGNDRVGADIVMLLDMSELVNNLEESIRRAVQFVIRKLSTSDRLSIITFSTKSVERKCVLCQMTTEAQKELLEPDLDLKVDDNDGVSEANISGGLKLALQVLDDRKFTAARSCAVMILSSGRILEDDGNALAKIKVDRYPIFTFLFGTDKECNSKPLKDIAMKSKGGTFSSTEPKNLCVAVSQCLGGLLSVLAKDLKLVIKPLKTTKVEDVHAGNYPQSNEGQIITVSLGNLYKKETRTILVNLYLPAVNKQAIINALEIYWSYSCETENLSSQSNPIVVAVKRTTAPSMKQTDSTKVEIKRVEIMKLIEEVAMLVNNENNFEEALNMIVDGQNSLEDIELEKPKPMVEMLKAELNEMVYALQPEEKETLKNIGLPFINSSETSHQRQRFAYRNNDVNNIYRFYATPRMDAYLEQAKKFDTDPIPTVAEDEKQELVDDLLENITTTFDNNLQIINNALENIQNIIYHKPYN